VTFIPPLWEISLFDIALISVRRAETKVGCNDVGEICSIPCHWGGLIDSLVWQSQLKGLDLLSVLHLAAIL